MVLNSILNWGSCSLWRRSLRTSLSSWRCHNGDGWISWALLMHSLSKRKGLYSKLLRVWHLKVWLDCPEGVGTQVILYLYSVVHSANFHTVRVTPFRKFSCCVVTFAWHQPGEDKEDHCQARSSCWTRGKIIKLRFEFSTCIVCETHASSVTTASRIPKSDAGIILMFSSLTEIISSWILRNIRGDFCVRIGGISIAIDYLAQHNITHLTQWQSPLKTSPQNTQPKTRQAGGGAWCPWNPPALAICVVRSDFRLFKTFLFTYFYLVEKLFNKGWQHRQKKKPRVFFVFRVISPEGTLQPYFDYRYD